VSALEVLSVGTVVTIQDRGRPGYLERGLSAGGAVDPVALDEGAVLLGDDPEAAVLEMAGFGGRFRARDDCVLALTGAEMVAEIDGQPVPHACGFILPRGAVLSIKGARSGSYGYLRLGGGIDAPVTLGGRATHLAVGFGRLLAPGDVLRSVTPGAGTPGWSLTPDPRFEGGTLRMLPGPQTGAFDPAMRERFEATAFRKSTRASRSSAQLDHDGAPFHADGQLSAVSEAILPGDIQIVASGTPFVLLTECQTTGGYPRMGSVISADLPKLVQAQPGTGTQLKFVTRDEALAARETPQARRARLMRSRRRLVRDPADIADLLAYQLVGGVTDGEVE